MQLKDAMRETCLHDLAEAWYNLLRAYQSANPDLAAAVLSTVERYVNWIDVSLVVNERSVSHLPYTICHLLFCYLPFAKLLQLCSEGVQELSSPWLDCCAPANFSSAGRSKDLYFEAQIRCC